MGWNVTRFWRPYILIYFLTSRKLFSDHHQRTFFLDVRTEFYTLLISPLGRWFSTVSVKSSCSLYLFANFNMNRKCHTNTCLWSYSTAAGRPTSFAKIVISFFLFFFPANNIFVHLSRQPLRKFLLKQSTLCGENLILMYMYVSDYVHKWVVKAFPEAPEFAWLTLKVLAEWTEPKRRWGGRKGLRRVAFIDLMILFLAIINPPHHSGTTRLIWKRIWMGTFHCNHVSPRTQEIWEMHQLWWVWWWYGPARVLS